MAIRLLRSACFMWLESAIKKHSLNGFFPAAPKVMYHLTLHGFGLANCALRLLSSTYHGIRSFSSKDSSRTIFRYFVIMIITIILF